MLELITAFSPSIYDAIGVAGFGLYVTNYALLTLRIMHCEYVSYFVLNWIAASCVLIGLSASFNLASALIQIFWIVISTVGIIIRLRRRRTVAFVSARSESAMPL